MRTVRVQIPHGYASTKEFLEDCGLTEVPDDQAKLETALNLIEALGGKTLICGSYAIGDDASRAYSLGAARAFEQAASIARQGLSQD